MFSIEIAIKWNDFWLVWQLTVCDSITLGYRRRARAWQLHSTVSATKMDSWGPQSFEFAEMYLWCILVPSISTSSGTSVPICSSLHRKKPYVLLAEPWWRKHVELLTSLQIHDAPLWNTGKFPLKLWRIASSTVVSEVVYIIYVYSVF